MLKESRHYTIFEADKLVMSLATILFVITDHTKSL